jgi:LysR family transcriptional regulator, low CO2-responsive transcriptional regulator
MTARNLLEADAVRSFTVFARHRSFTAAAAELHISQPSLHVKIGRLGTALGVRLYERHGRELVLTAAGERLAAFGAEQRRRLDDFMDGLAGLDGALTLAAGRGALRWVVAGAVRRLAGDRGLQVLTADRDAAVAALVSGAADLAVIAHDPPPRQYGSRLIASFPQVLMVDDEHALAGRARLRLSDLDGLDLVVPPAGRPHRRALDRALLDAGVTWRPTAEVDGWDLLVHLASLGIGACVVNGCVPAPAGLTAVPITDLPVVRYWVVWRTQGRDRHRDHGRDAAVADAVDALTHERP